MIIGGRSAGASLAVTTLLRLRDMGIADGFAGAALQFGTYDMSALTPAGRLIADEYFLRAYVGHVADRTDPDISPIYADLHGLPPTLMVVGSEDVLLEDNLAMAGRCPQPATTSSSGSIPKRHMGSRAIRPHLPGRRDAVSMRGCSNGSESAMRSGRLARNPLAQSPVARRCHDVAWNAVANAARAFSSPGEASPISANSVSTLVISTSGSPHAIA